MPTRYYTFWVKSLSGLCSTMWQQVTRKTQLSTGKDQRLVVFTLTLRCQLRILQKDTGVLQAQGILNSRSYRPLNAIQKSQWGPNIFKYPIVTQGLALVSMCQNPSLATLACGPCPLPDTMWFSYKESHPILSFSKSLDCRSHLLLGILPRAVYK